MLRQKIAIDLGTTNTLVYDSKKGLVYNEPTVIAIERKGKRCITAGHNAKEMVGRTTENIEAIHPLSQGVISDFDSAQKLLEFLLKKIGINKKAKPRVIICAPSGGSEVEKKAVEDVAYQAGAGKVTVVDEPIAAAIGSGLSIGEPIGRMIVDIGGGTTDVAVISLGGIVLSTSLKVAGNDFDEALIRYVRNTYNLLIGDKTAEKLKIAVGGLFKNPDEEESMAITGRDLVSGLPKSIEVTRNETVPVLKGVASQILDAILGILEKTPGELAADISLDGIMLTGGGSILQGMDQFIHDKTGVEIIQANDPMASVGIGLDIIAKQGVK